MKNDLSAATIFFLMAAAAIMFIAKMLFSGQIISDFWHAAIFSGAAVLSVALISLSFLFFRRVLLRRRRSPIYALPPAARFRRFRSA